MRVLLTGFDPFEGNTINPALEVVKGVREKIGEIEIKKLEIPTVFGKSMERILKAAEEFRPDAILCIGQAGGRYEMSLERVAINLNDARIKDNEGNQPIDEMIYPDGENAYFSNLPIKAMMQEMREEGIPTSISNTAGTFVCNYVMYGVLYHIAKHSIAKKGGFIHIPYMPSQIINKPNTPYMEKEMMIKGVEIAIKCIAKYSQDITLSGGREC